MKKKRSWYFIGTGNGFLKLLRMMRVVLFMMLVGLTHLSAAVRGQEMVVNLQANQMTVIEIISSLEKELDKDFFFKKESVDVTRKMDVRWVNVDLAEVIKEIFGHNFTFSLVDNMIVVSNTTQPATPQERSIEGTVVDSNGEVLPGVTIRLKGATLGVSTDNNGRFKIVLPESDEIVLVFSFVGMETQEVKLTNERTLKITMHDEDSAVDEVVVTGIFTRKKEGFTGSANKITGEQLSSLSSSNVLRAIEMLDPGFRMNVSNIAGSNPSAVPEFQMRGQSNMGDYSTDDDVILRGDIDTRPNQPLFVLDGIIGVSVTKILDMDPAQIESITLLKDAAAMVIYGSRASNGVVVVETKAPEAGKLRISYNGNYKLIVPNLTGYDLLNSSEKLELEQNAGIYETAYIPADVQRLYNDYKNRLLDVQRGVDTYWLSKPLRTVFTHRHGLNLEGGDRALRYKIYFGYSSSPGVMKKTGHDGLSGSIDLRYRYKELLVSNIMYVDYSVSDRTSSYGAFSEYAQMNPYFRYNDENGHLLRILETYYSLNQVERGISGYLLNPAYNSMYKQKDQNRSFEVRNTFKAEYRPMPSLRLSLDANISKVVSDVDDFLSANHSKFQGLTPENKGSYTWSHTDNTSYNISLTASYNKLFGEVHMLSAFANTNIDQRKNHTVRNSATGFPNENMDEVFLGAKPVSLSGNEGTAHSLGMVGTVNYSYDQRYAIDFSMRVDASSEFGRNNRFAPFWSTGIRWNANNEKFLSDSKIFDELVLRMTYGVTGSQGFSPYQSLQMYSYDNTMYVYKSSDVIGTVMQSMGNPDLKWQKTDAYNVGLDFTMFNNILSARFEYYYKYTKNTLLDFSLAPSIGFTTITDNMGNITNDGYELTLRIMPYRNIEKRMNISISAMGSYNKNRIRNISNALRVRNEESINSTAARPLPRYEEGYSMSRIWVVRSLGIDPYDGREIFLDRDGNMTNVYNAMDQVPYGDTEPKLRGSLNLIFNWGGFNMTVGSRYQFGGDIYNQTLINKVENANVRYNVDRRALTERWQEQGDWTAFKGVSTAVAGQSTRASSRFVIKNNIFEISTINLQYRLESRYNQFIKKIGLSSAAFGIYIEDIARLSTVKMERGIDYPFASSVSLSLNLVF